MFAAQTEIIAATAMLRRAVIDGALQERNTEKKPREKLHCYIKTLQLLSLHRGVLSGLLSISVTIIKEDYLCQTIPLSYYCCGSYSLSLFFWHSLFCGA